MSAKVKQRLVGATVLLAIAVLAWPLFMGASKDRYVVIESKIPPRADFQPFEVPLAQRPAGLPEPGSWQEGVSESQVEEEPKPVVDEEGTKASTAESTAVVATPIAAELDASGLPQGWMVQVGSFGQLENAEKLAAKLRAGGYKTFVKPAESDPSKLTKVYVGPLLDESLAQRVANDIKSQYQLTPKISKFLP